MNDSGDSVSPTPNISPSGETTNGLLGSAGIPPEICRYCGNQISPETRVCCSCGTSFTTPNTAPLIDENGSAGVSPLNAGSATFILVGSIAAQFVAAFLVTSVVAMLGAIHHSASAIAQNTKAVQVSVQTAMPFALIAAVIAGEWQCC